jgi:hypothetical protein
VCHSQKKPCEVNSPFSSSSSSSRSEEQEVFQPEPGTGMKRTHRALPWDHWNLRPVIHTPYAVSVQMSRDRFLALLTMFYLNNNAKAARGQPNQARKMCHWKFSTRKSLKDCLLARYGNAAQGQTNKSAKTIPVTLARLQGKSQCSCRMCAERSKRQTGKTVKKCTTMYCRKCDARLCIWQF